MVVDFRQQLLCFSGYLPSLKVWLLALDLSLQSASFPIDIVSDIPTDPLAVDVHINAHVNIALDVDRDIGRWNRLPQSRSWRDW
jgi:hypothetical protein